MLNFGSFLRGFSDGKKSAKMVLQLARFICVWVHI